MKNTNQGAVLVENLTKTYRLYDSPLDRVKEAFHPMRREYHRKYHALQDVSLTIPKGQFYGIIGRNGSGKSTLLQLIAGILQPTQGSVHVNGSVAALLELGAGFNPEFTGRENVFLNASLLGLSREEIEDRFDEIAAFADIGNFIDQPVKTYSSGMYVRLAFAVAINVRPDILIVDEALAVGDMFFQQKCIRYMEENMQECTKLLVTHDMHAVVNLCEKVAVLHDGELVFEGLPLESAEYYTKILHNDLFRDKDKQQDSVDKSEQLEEPETESGGNVQWVPVLPDSMAGASEVLITHTKFTTQDGAPVTTVTPGDQLGIHMKLQSKKVLSDPIFGYLIKDRVGNGICGDNTLSLSERPETMAPGEHVVSLSIQWPDIYPADYVITLGVGEGDHPLYHVIQCWAHNVILVKALNPSNEVHGIFTNNIVKYEVEAFG